MRTISITADIIALLEKEPLLKKSKQRKKTPKTSKGKKKEVTKAKKGKTTMKTVALPGMEVVHTVAHTVVVMYPDGSVAEFPRPQTAEKSAEEKTKGCCCDKPKET